MKILSAKFLKNNNHGKIHEVWSSFSSFGSFICSTPLRFFQRNSTQIVARRWNVIFFIMFQTQPNKGVETLGTKIAEYFALFSFTQWTFSLISLVLCYWLAGYYYNKWLAEKGGWLDAQTRVWLIVVDLLTNFVIGVYYMYHRETLMGQFMVQCPIAISPVIFLLELICFHLYSSYIKGTGFFKKRA